MDSINYIEDEILKIEKEKIFMDLASAGVGVFVGTFIGTFGNQIGHYLGQKFSDNLKKKDQINF